MNKIPLSKSQQRRITIQKGESMDKIQTSEELKPCPFCGSKNIDSEGWKSNGGKSGPACDDCGAMAETIEIWNTRPLDAAIRAPLIEALEEAKCTICRLCRKLNPQHEDCTSCSEIEYYCVTLARAKEG